MEPTSLPPDLVPCGLALYSENAYLPAHTVKSFFNRRCRTYLVRIFQAGELMCEASARDEWEARLLAQDHYRTLLQNQKAEEAAL